MLRAILLLLSLSVFGNSFVRKNNFQQQVNYTINVTMNADSNKYFGTEKIEYYNNSNDTLYQIFIHAYNNAFQPNSMMDQRSRYLGKLSITGKPDWDTRVKDRIQYLTTNEQGYLHITQFKYKGQLQTIDKQETIVQIKLHKPIPPHSKAIFEVVFEAQVPVQIRRSGRNNPEGVNLSMSQWYPKVCAYDHLGWHPTPYVAREFYGEFGNFDVQITIDRKYYIASTGYLTKTTLLGNQKVWHIKAKNVHDFMWAADTAYVDIYKTIIDTIYKKTNRFDIHVVYKKSTPQQDSAWHQLLETVVKVYPYIAKHYGHYPYQQYSFIQGGDGGMEYPMATLIKGSSTGTAFHEWMHNWYQGVVATNESLYPWMDEGFATFAENNVSAYHQQYVLHQPIDSALPLHHAGSYKAYFFMHKKGQSEPLTTHADYYHSNLAYSISSYAKGAIFLEQLGYIIGSKKRDLLLLKYFETFKFTHPTVDDFIHLANYFSQIQLDWYKEGWINSTRYIDYAIDSVYNNAQKTTILLQSKGDLYMPIDLVITLKNGKKIMHYIPLYTMFGQKENEDPTMTRILQKPWQWTNPQYILNIDESLSNIAQIEIDPSQRMADVDRKNNLLILNTNE